MEVGCRGSGLRCARSWGPGWRRAAGRRCPTSTSSTSRTTRSSRAQLAAEIEANPDEYGVILDRSQYAEAYAHLDAIRDEILSADAVNYPSRFDWETHIIDDDEVLNAFAAPGGYIYVYTGLIRYLDSEDHFAGVMGHEIAHADQRHSTQQLTKAYGIESLLGLIFGDADPGLAADVAAGLLSLEFSRTDEAEADEYSVRYLCDTPYAANGAAGFFEKLLAEGSVEIPEFLSTHPSSASRVQDINAMAEELGCSTGRTRTASGPPSSLFARNYGACAQTRTPGDRRRAGAGVRASWRASRSCALGNPARATAGRQGRASPPASRSAVLALGKSCACAPRPGRRDRRRRSWRCGPSVWRPPRVRSAVLAREILRVPARPGRQATAGDPERRKRARRSVMGRKCVGALRHARLRGWRPGGVRSAMLTTLALLACTPKGDDVVVDLTASAAPSAYVPSVAHVTVSGAQGETFVEFGLDGAFDQRTPSGDHLMGLKASHSYDWRAVVVDADGVRHESEPGTFDVPAPPAELKPFTVTVDDPDAEWATSWPASSAAASTPSAVIIDRDGDPSGGPNTGGTVMVTPELGLDHASILWSESDFEKWDDLGKLVRISLDGEARTETRLKMGHHDFAQLEDGRIGFLGLSFADVDIGGDSYRMASDTISVGPEGMTDADQPTLVFDMFRDFPLEPEATCNHVTSREPRLGEQNVAEWTHANSLMYLPETGAYYVNDKNTDWLFAVDAATGEVRWILNGRGGDFAQPDGEPVWNAVDQTTLWSHGHMSDIWDGGGLLFDNGDHHPSGGSRAVEFAWDEASMTAEITWSFEHPQGLKTPALGDVRRMPGDHVMVTWSGLGSIDEVARDGGNRVVWEATYPGDDLVSDGQTVGRIVPLADLYAP
ncbi:MAG: M48 family metalloprotease [Myxococcota bacterium]